MLYLEDWPDPDRLPPNVPGDTGAERVLSNEESPWSCVQVQVLRVGELEVNDARSVDMRRCGAKAVASDRRRWCDTIGKPAMVLACT